MVVCVYTDEVYIAIAYAEDDQLMQATQVVHFITAADTGYPPLLALNLEPEGPRGSLRCLSSVWG